MSHELGCLEQFVMGDELISLFKEFRLIFLPVRNEPVDLLHQMIINELTARIKCVCAEVEFKI